MKILYYNPEASHSRINVQWLYGLDLIWKLLDLPHSFTPVGRYGGYSKEMMRYLYKNSDCLLRPTRHDGYSFSVQEALHYGLPVLHTYPIPGVILIKPEINDIEEKLIKLEEKI